ncbi:MAG: hypothetical protein J6V25_07260 [Oscillospiraceae bacterium]|nr:hypothetical protein [Oscillospiraceae bacterium]
MENEKRNEKADIIDEVLEEVSGGVGGTAEAYCEICKKRYYIALMVPVREGYYICRACHGKLDKA